MMKLFEPIHISGMTLVNRVVFTTIVLRMAGRDGCLCRAQRDFYLRVAQGGTGMLVIEGGIEDYERESRYLLGIYDDKHIPDLKNMVDEVHSTSESKIGMQLMHILKKDPMSGKAGRIEDLRHKDVKQMVEAFGRAAERAKKIGFDFVEIHAAHGLTLGSFLSFLHKGEDKYGPLLENRIEVVGEVIHEIRRSVGNTYPVGIRINGDDFISHGNTLKQAKSFSLKLAELQVAYISVSAGGRHEDAERMEDGTLWPYGGYSGTRCMPLAYMPNGVNVYLAAAIKEVVQSFGIPVITAGKIPDPESAEKILEDGKADLVGMARPILCDQEWAKKAREKRWAEIAKCMYCGFCNDYFNRLRKPVVCSACTYPTNKCPAGIDIPLLHYLISERRFDEASNYLLDMIPFPSILGRLCFAPCEDLCRQKIWGGTIPIRALHRFIDEKAAPQSRERRFTKGRVETVAVVGSGPAGLTGAYYLARMGYPVTIFESLPVLGGMLSVGVPEYRLPRDILNTELNLIRKLVVEIKLNTKVGTDVTLADLKRDFNAVFLAIGAHKGKKLGVENEESKGVVDGVEFLRDLNLGKGVEKKDKVVIVGGGNVAMDCARTCSRLGFEEVLISYRRSKDEMPAVKEEIQRAEEEGIKFNFLTVPKRLISENGKVKGIECLRTKLGEPDASGRMRPIPIEGSEFTINTEMVISAVGQEPDLSNLSERDINLPVKDGLLLADPITLETSIPGIFAGGDVATGEGSIIQAVAAGKKAAISIDKYLRKNGEVEQPERVKLRIRGKSEDEIGESLLKNIVFKIPSLAPEKRVRSFAEVELGLTEEAAVEQATRCWRCDRYHLAEK
jgi:NADPH-dependent glutamate synthase beta subunit-like oxidoreductase